MDLDGPLNDKGAYVIAPLQQRMSIRDEHVMTWTSYPGKPPGHKTTGFMSQISPDGRFVASTLNESLYVVNFTDFRFLQVFYPTRGIIAYYDRQTRESRRCRAPTTPAMCRPAQCGRPTAKT